ncbi:MAG: FtsX-like permease family protein [Candidatus Bathyarchaeota archaeon]|nr:FtsX-like permease family protein [Candidatus Bathyarchaeota archaeon]
MGVLSRAVRNISRRKIRALLVIIALGFCMAIMVSIPAGVTANQESTMTLTQNLGNVITQTEATINQTLTQIECTLTPSFEGFGFAPPSSGGSGTMPQPPSGGNFTSSGPFGGGNIPGQFGGGQFGSRGSTPMNESLYYDISSIEGVAAVVPTLTVSQGTNQTIEMFGRSFTRLIVDYIIEGVALTSAVDEYPILPTNITAGRNLQAGDSGVVLISANNSAFFGAGVGDTIEILGQTFLVVGIHGSTGVEDQLTLYMNLSDAQSLTDNVGYITGLTVFAESSDAVNDVASAISELHPELTVVTSQQRLQQLEIMRTNYETALANAEATLAQTQGTAIQVTIVAVAAASLIVLFVMLYTVRERTREIGTLKAIGFSNWTVMSQFMLEGVLLSLVAGLVGIAVASFAAPTLSGLLLPTLTQQVNLGRSAAAASVSTGTATIALTPESVLMALGVAVLLGALGSLYPAWRAARTRPAEAMRYE